jgi:hypothetical protein
MNRPSTKYTFLADKEYPSNFKILREFAKEVVKELRANPDGVQLPLGFVQIVRRLRSSNNATVKKKYGKSYKFTNDNTDGAIITTRAWFVTNAYNHARDKSNGKYYSAAFIRLFKVEWYKPLKKVQYDIAQTMEYLNYRIF